MQGVCLFVCLFFSMPYTYSGKISAKIVISSQSAGVCQFCTYDIKVRLSVYFGLFLTSAFSGSKVGHAGRFPVKEWQETGQSV